MNRLYPANKRIQPKTNDNITPFERLIEGLIEGLKTKVAVSPVRTL